MNKLFSMTATLLLCVAALLPTAHAQAPGDITGTWTFFVTINGAPPCECIQIARLRSDGSLDGPANDHLSGATSGTWKRTSANEVKFAFVQNNINADGTAAGEYIIRGSMVLNSEGDSGAGVSTFQLVNNAGKVLFTGSSSFRASKLKIE